MFGFSFEMSNHKVLNEDRYHKVLIESYCSGHIDRDDLPLSYGQENRYAEDLINHIARKGSRSDIYSYGFEKISDSDYPIIWLEVRGRTLSIIMNDYKNSVISVYEL